MKSPKLNSKQKANLKDFPTLKIESDRDIAMDFAEKAYQKFDKIIKSVVLFGSAAKQTSTPGSDIDIIIIVDDASITFDQELVGWYRGELGKIIASSPYKKELHINTVKLTTWWSDMLKGDPIVINILRYGEAMLDFGGFFNPLKILLQEGKIKPTPEAIYTALQRAPQHLARSRNAELSSIEGIYWAMVDSAHALLIAAKLMPPSPEHIANLLRENFVAVKLLDEKYVSWYEQTFDLYKRITRGDITSIKGNDIEVMQSRADEFIRKMAQIIDTLLK